MNEDLPKILEKHWNDKRGEEAFPAEYEISENELDAIWQNCFIVRISDAKFIYESFGESLIEAYSYNMQGEEVVDDVLYPESPPLAHKLIEVLNSKEPLTYDGALINKENIDIKFRKILVPLGEEGRITHILGGMIWRPF